MQGALRWYYESLSQVAFILCMGYTSLLDHIHVTFEKYREIASFITAPNVQHRLVFVRADKGRPKSRGRRWQPASGSCPGPMDTVCTV